MRFLARRWALGAASYAVTMPLVRWTWRGLSDDRFETALPEYRPSDIESIIDMMQGRYLFAGKLVDTQGVSPFSITADNDDWRQSLHSFAWLRHFREARDEGSRRFARTLVLDWIGRRKQFDGTFWAPGLTAQRVMNWLRHYPLIVEDANPEQKATIARSLATQVQALRVRSRLIAEPYEALLVAVALTGAAIAVGNDDAVERYVGKLKALLGRQLDADGLHLSRSPRIQLALLIELVTLRQALGSLHRELAAMVVPDIEAMHRAFDRLILSTGEPAFFNGGGQLPHDIVVSVQAHSQERRHEEVTALVGGYGRLAWGRSVVIADRGLVPPLDYSTEAAAGALAFEFSHGGDLIVGNCGPAPAELPDAKPLFRRGIAHSGPTVDAASAADIIGKGPLAGRLRRRGAESEMTLDPGERLLTARTYGFGQRFGIAVERRLTLLAEGRTLVGQDRMLATGTTASGLLTLRFHLAPSADVLLDGSSASDVVRIKLATGAEWTFLWEGATMREEESVRQSAYFGLSRTRQLVLETAVEPGHEVAWIFTLETA